MSLSYNKSIAFSLLVTGLLLVVNQAFSFGISQTNQLKRDPLPQPNLHHQPFHLPWKSTSDSSLRQSDNAVSENESSQTPKAYSYHLLWTPGFARKVMMSTLLLALGHKFILPRLLNPSTSNATMGWISSVLLSLLASSCCLIQMMANVLISTVGCLGLNTALGPVRPYFFSLLLYVNALAVIQGMSSIPQVTVRSIIALLPEGLHFWTGYRNQRYRNQAQTKSKEEGTEDPLNSSNESTSAKMESVTKNVEVEEPIKGSINMVLELDVPTMGCVACINKIDGLMRKSQEQSTGSNKVRSISSILDPEKAKGGKTLVQLSVGSAEEAEEIGYGLVEQLDKMGFPGASVTSKELV